jgi:hypothetical protein
MAAGNGLLPIGRKGDAPDAVGMSFEATYFGGNGRLRLVGGRDWGQTGGGGNSHHGEWAAA